MLFFHGCCCRLLVRQQQRMNAEKSWRSARRSPRNSQACCAAVLLIRAFRISWAATGSFISSGRKCFVFFMLWYFCSIEFGTPKWLKFKKNEGPYCLEAQIAEANMPFNFPQLNQSNPYPYECYIRPRWYMRSVHNYGVRCCNDTYRKKL